MKQINLVPAEYAYSRYLRKRVVVWVTFVLAVGAMVCGIGLNLNARTRKAQHEKQQLAARLETLRGISDELQAVSDEKAATCGRLKEVYAIQRKRANAAVLHDISAACNDKVFLTQVAMNVLEPAPDAKPAAPRTPPARTPPPKRPPRAGSPPQPPEAAAPPANDAAKARTVLTLKGYALTNLDLTQFVSGLSSSKAIKQVNLKFWRQETVIELKLIGFEVECYPNVGS